jgi:hypothetical protein
MGGKYIGLVTDNSMSSVDRIDKAKAMYLITWE